MILRWMEVMAGRDKLKLKTGSCMLGLELRRRSFGDLQQDIKERDISWCI